MAKERSWPGVVTGCVALGVFLITLAPDLTWANFGGDGGELITAAVTLGVPHPSGYPTYVLLGKLIGWIPWGSVAWRFHLFSAVCVAVAAGFVSGIYLVVLSWSKYHDWVALAGGLTFAFIPLVWGQAVIAEVYGLNLAVLSALLWVLVSSTQSPKEMSARRSVAVGVLAGLSVTTHLTSLLIFPLVISFVPRKRWVLWAVGVLVGLVPFGLIFLFAESGSPVRWGNPTTLEGWWWLVSGEIYRGNVWGLPAGRTLPRLIQWTQTLWQDYTWLLILPIIANLIIKTKDERRKTEMFRPPSSVLHPLIWNLTIALYFCYAFFYDVVDAMVFTLPAFLLLSVRLATGLQKMRRFALILPLLLLMLNFTPQNLSYEDAVRPTIEPYLLEAPNRAILMMPGDETIFAMWYFRHVEGIRPDLILVDSNLFAFDWYRQHLGDLYPDLQHLTEDDLAGFQEQNLSRRPVCIITQQLNCLETQP